MLLNYLYNLYIFMEPDFAQLLLICVRNKLAVSIYLVYALYTPSIYL